MIGFFPKLYEDELVYSWIARYLVYSGYTSASDAYQDLYFNKNLRPSVELMNNMIDDAKAVMARYTTIDELILQHTLFPEYGRFIDPIKRERLLREGDFTRGNWINNLMMPFSNGERYLMYCPLCAEDDRNVYGETFWHRRHQINNIKICVKHDVYLQSSNIVIERNLTRLKAAEIVIPRETIISKCEDEIIMKLAEYMVSVFDNIKYSHERIGRYINSRIPSKYIYSNGNRKMYALYADYKEFYNKLDPSELMSMNSMCRLLGGHRGVYGYICQLGVLLNISPADLLNKIDEQNYDIFERVSQLTGEPLDHVQLIGEAIIAELKKDSVLFIKEARHKDNIDRDDLALLPEIEKAVRKVYGEGDERPRKVSISNISSILHVDMHRLKRMKKCMEVINRFYESQEEYWAREMVWAVKMIEKNGDELNIRHIRNLTNLRRDNMIDALEYIKVSDLAIYDILSVIIQM